MMPNPDDIERRKALQVDAERASQIRKDAMSGKLQKCPKCQEVAVFWNDKGENGEGCWECLACETVYLTEYSLIAAETNARNEERYKNSQRFSS